MAARRGPNGTASSARVGEALRTALSVEPPAGTETSAVRQRPERIATIVRAFAEPVTTHLHETTTNLHTHLHGYDFES